MSDDGGDGFDYENAEDSVLLQRWQAGDRKAGSTLYTRHFKSLYLFIKSKVHDSDVQDILHTAFLKLRNAKYRSESSSSFRGFVMKIAYHTMLHHFRKRQRNREDVFGDRTSIEDIAPSPSSVMHDKQQRHVLDQALRRIPINDYVLLELFYRKGMSSSEISEILSIPPSTLRDRKAKARKRLIEVVQSLLDGREETSEPRDELEVWTALKHDISRDDEPAIETPEEGPPEGPAVRASVDPKLHGALREPEPSLRPDECTSADDSAPPDPAHQSASDADLDQPE